MGIVTVIASGKGGVGKSTITSILSIELAKLGKKVLIIDGDAGLGNLDYILGVSEKLVYDISDVVDGSCDNVTKAIYRCKCAGELFLIAAPQSEDDLISATVMKQLVFMLRDHYDYIFIDSPAGLGRGFKSAAAPADRAIIVTDLNPISIRASGKVSAALLDSNIDSIRLIINRFSKKALKAAKLYDDLDAVIDSCGARLIGIVPDDEKILLSGSELLDLKKDAPSACACRRIAARITGKDIPLKSFT